MKKILLLVLLLSAFVLRPSAQIVFQTDNWFDFNNNNQVCSMGFDIGQAGHGTKYADLGFGLNVSILGFYVDFLIAPPENETNNHVENVYWQDDQAWVLNFGYQIPVRRWLRITPLIGYSQTSYGVVDGSSVNIHVDNEYSGHISHDYIPYEKFHEFNFGGAIAIRLFNVWEINAAVTRRAIYGGITFDLGPTALND